MIRDADGGGRAPSLSDDQMETRLVTRMERQRLLRERPNTLSERGIDISREFAKPWTDEVIRAADVVSMSCGGA
ncbi:hypothetical protein ADL12_38835 [Streptomyces regalis]|uniref:Uncharacterized protein n=2 Tax=Streptomyces regalis TaxID=68262 RepID=A0A101JBG9_9ACTN|nr:hypothetical protein ADL12_38835 [Streptomyces regalis]